MKHLLLTTIAAVLLVGCGPPSPDISIHDAASKGDIEAVKQHIAAGTDANAKTSGGATPLHFAAQAGQKEIIELLIAEGADVNAKYNGGNTPLDWVIRSKPRDKARFLPEIAALLRKHGGKTGEELKGK